MKDIHTLITDLKNHSVRALGRAITHVEAADDAADQILASLDEECIRHSLVIGVTGPPGAGKSTLVNKLVASYRQKGHKVGVIAIDPSSPLSGGAILGDRIRMMQHAVDNNVIVRSMATRGRLGGLCAAAGGVVRVMAGFGCDPVIIETVGVGQSEIDIIRLADLTALVLAPGLGDDIQAMKAGLLEVADILVVNKADCPGADVLALDLETEVRQRLSHKQKENAPTVCLTSASTGSGIEELIAGISTVDALHRQSGERIKRRDEAVRREILDWTIELLKPRLKAHIDSDTQSLTGNPRRAAQKVVERIKNRE